MRRGIVQAAVCVTVALVCMHWAQSALASPRILLSTPHAWQVVQRGTDGRADVVVSGRCVGVSGSVRVAWGRFRTGARCDRAGRFRATLQGMPTGQATLRVSSVAARGVSCYLEKVAVGDIYVIAGQSNASGCSPDWLTYTSSTWRASLFGNDYRWRELRDPVDSADGQVDGVSRDLIAGGSVWPEVATVLLAEEKAPVAFVPCPRSSTAIDRWDPRRPVLRPAGTLYASMARRVAHVGGRVRAVLWWQGERDARKLTPPAEYRASLVSLADAVWRDFHAPMVVAQIGDFGPNYTYEGIDDVRGVQQRLWGSHHIVQGPLLYDIDLRGQVHVISRADMTLAGQRWAAAILRGVLYRDSGRTPRLLRAEREGDDTVVLTADIQLAESAGLGGFSVRAGGADVPVVEASAEGATVRLVLGESPSGALTVSLGSGRSAAGAAVPTDTSAWRLPMVPFLGLPVIADTP